MKINKRRALYWAAQLSTIARNAIIVIWEVWRD